MPDSKMDVLAERDGVLDRCERPAVFRGSGGEGPDVEDQPAGRQIRTVVAWYL
jgi:hypothetical protein